MRGTRGGAHLGVGEGDRLGMAHEVHAVEQDVFAPHGVDAEEAPEPHDHALATDVELAQGQPLVGGEGAHAQLRTREMAGGG